MFDPPVALAVATLAAYVVGSLPFGFLTARFVAGIDIRKSGSGNIGATNIGRVLGAKWGVLVLVLDCLKGLLPTLLLPLWLAGPRHPLFNHLQVASGLAAIVGHMFPCWLSFRGGKGVATSLGAVLVLGSWAIVAGLGAFVSLMTLFRIVSLASMAAAIAFSVCRLILLLPEPFGKENWSLAGFSIAVPVLIVYQHRGNLKRLLRGDEPRFRAAPPSTREGMSTGPPA